MKKYKINNISLYNCDNKELMRSLKDGSVDVILTDPPYLYLKNQKLEREFDEQLFFEECKRVLTKDGFIVMFGRGTSFYRWNTILDDLGFTFKEEIIWDKCMQSGAMMAISRRHETVSIFSKGKGSIKEVYVSFFEANQYKPKKILETINRMKTAFGNRETFDLLEKYYKGEKVYQVNENFSKYNVTAKKRVALNRTVHSAKNLEEGYKETSIIDSIYEESRDHYNTIHPTQKPVRLLERLLALVIPQDKEPKNITILDPFGGSFSTMEATYNMGMKGISCEIDEEYFDSGKERIISISQQMKLF